MLVHFDAVGITVNTPPASEEVEGSKKTSYGGAMGMKGDIRKSGWVAGPVLGFGLGYIGGPKAAPSGLVFSGLTGLDLHPWNWLGLGPLGGFHAGTSRFPNAWVAGAHARLHTAETPSNSYSARFFIDPRVTWRYRENGKVFFPGVEIGVRPGESFYITGYYEQGTTKSSRMVRSFGVGLARGRN
jgi:hypothetical protein